MKEKVVLVQNVSINDHRMVHTDGIGRELVKRGYEVHVFVQRSKKEPQFEDLPYSVFYIPGDTYSMAGQVEFALGVFRILRKNRYDVIHAKNPLSSVFPALLWRNIKGTPKVIYDIRGLWVDFGVFSGFIRFGPVLIAPFLNKADVICMNKVDKVIAISEELKNVLLDRGVNKDRVEVIIGDGVDLEKARASEGVDIGNLLGVKGKVVGYVGGIGRARASRKIIEAFEIVKKRSNGEVALVMVGPFGEEENRADEYDRHIREVICRRGLEGSVFFAGFVPHDEVFGYMKSFDVAASYHEGDFPFYNVAVPTKVLEYMATGRAIVTTDHKMYRNLLTHGKDAYLTEQNPKAFAEGVLRLLENDELSERLSKNAQITAEKYSLEKVTDEVEEVYERLLSQTSGRT